MKGYSSQFLSHLSSSKWYDILARAYIEAVSVRKILFPSRTGKNRCSFNKVASSCENPPSGPMQIRIRSFTFTLDKAELNDKKCSVLASSSYANNRVVYSLLSAITVFSETGSYIFGI